MPGTQSDLGLALSGGGAKGAFQVGALDYLINEKGLDFRVVAGVSTGALQAVMVAQGDVARLRRIWEGIEGRDDICTKRFGGFVGAVVGADSAYSNEPLKELIREHVEPAKIRASGRRLKIGVASLQTGVYRPVTEEKDHLRGWTLASTAIPAFFEPVELEGQQFVDGGVRDITPLGAVFEEKPRACLAILASPRELAPKEAEFDDLLDIGTRALEIMTDEIFQNDLADAEWVNALLEKVRRVEATLQGQGGPGAVAALAPLHDFLREYAVIPTYTLAPKRLLIDTLEFDPPKIAAAIRQGWD
ncbi:MAG: patatin-like phospholipase family protein, partial [Planctomycetota bacterium]